MAGSKRGLWALTFTASGWAFAVFLAIGIAIAVPALVLFEQAARLQFGGVTVQGQVTRLWQATESCGKDNLESCTSYNVAYGFDAGGWRTTQTSVGSDLYASLKESGPIAVRYVRDDPTINEVDFGWTFFGGLMLLLFAMAFGGFGGVMLLGRVRQAHRLLTLRATGEERQATVTAREATRWSVNRKPQVILRWRDVTGVVGASVAQPPEGLPEVGAGITIYADPDGKLASVWLGDSGAR